MKTFDRVFLIGVDGAGAFFRQAETPCIDKIMKNGACTYDADTAIPSISAQCWGSMLLGVSPDTHKLTNSYVESHEYPTDSVNPSLFRRIREAYPDSELASFSNWSPINHGIVEHNLDVEFFSEGDDDLTDGIIAYLDKASPKFMFVQFDSVDGAGHCNGYGTSAHLAQINEVDGYIGRIYEKLSDRGLLENALFIVTADHGGTPGGDHGGVSEAELKIYFGASGDGVKVNGEIGEMYVWDISAVVLEALGLDVPEYDENGFIGIVPDGLFDGFIPKERRYVLSADDVSSPAVPCDAVQKLSAAGDLRCAIFFEGDVTDACGKTTAIGVGRIKYYGTGVYARCAELGKRGHVKLPDMKVGKDSFTLSLFLRRDSAEPMENAPTLFGTKNRRSDDSDGFTFLYAGNLNAVKIWNDGKEYFISLPLSEDAVDWVNITVVFDREAGKIKQYCNFEPYAEGVIPAELDGVSFDADTFVIGNDASGAENEYINLMYDDLLIYGGALSTADVKKLREYYKG
ncbi:MAG: alkaline phosphatase family protein [Clostridia bacterium]|nr:alkaline phosphatase family protein [Clostridia bacterium]